jgi:hypothetical protein
LRKRNIKLMKERVERKRKEGIRGEGRKEGMERRKGRK